MFDNYDPGFLGGFIGALISMACSKISDTIFIAYSCQKQVDSLEALAKSVRLVQTGGSNESNIQWANDLYCADSLIQECRRVSSWWPPKEDGESGKGFGTWRINSGNGTGFVFHLSPHPRLRSPCPRLHSPCTRRRRARLDSRRRARLRPHALVSIPHALDAAVPASAPHALVSIPHALDAAVPASIHAVVPASAPHALVSIPHALDAAVPASAPHALVSISHALDAAAAAALPASITQASAAVIVPSTRQGAVA